MQDLSRVLWRISAGVDVTEPQARDESLVSHAYQHLNWFWNGRKRAYLLKQDLSQEECRRLSAFPEELYDPMARGRPPDLTPAADGQAARPQRPAGRGIGAADKKIVERVSPADAAFCSFHLAEAIEQLSAIVRSMSSRAEPAPSEQDLEVQMAHAYKHLNWFWNGRKRSDRSGADMSDEEYYTFSAFPEELYDSMAMARPPGAQPAQAPEGAEWIP